MHFNTALFTLAGFASQVVGHGLITSPAPRAAGAASRAACGQAFQDGSTKDNTTFIEALTRGTFADSEYHADECNLFLCKGLQFADNTLNVHEYKPGQVVDIKLWVRIPHKGYANVSIVDTTTNAVIGQPLYNWPEYLGDDPRAVYPKNNTEFSITIPELGDKCVQPGHCVSPIPFSSSFSHSKIADKNLQRSSNGTGFQCPVFLKPTNPASTLLCPQSLFCGAVEFEEILS